MTLADADVVSMVEALAEYERGDIRKMADEALREFLFADCATSLPALRPLVERYLAIRASGAAPNVECCCSRCGGIDVSYAVWYHPNAADTTGEIFGSWNAGDNTFCDDCDEPTDLVDKSAEPERFAKLRDKAVRREARDAAREAVS